MEFDIQMKVKRLDKGLPVPCYANPGDAGLDLYSAVDVRIEPLHRVMIPTGLAIALPQGYAGFVQPRSGLALKKGLSIVNTPGLVDSGYRGELKVIAINNDTDEPIDIAWPSSWYSACLPWTSLRLTSSTRPSAARAASAPRDFDNSRVHFP